MNAPSILDPESVRELRDRWPGLSSEQRAEAFSRIPREEAFDFFLSLMPLGLRGTLL